MANAKYLQPHKADLGPERMGKGSELRWLQFDSSCIRSGQGLVPPVDKKDDTSIAQLMVGWSCMSSVISILAPRQSGIV